MIVQMALSPPLPAGGGPEGAGGASLSLIRMALSPLTPLSQNWERGELDSPPPKLGEGLRVGAVFFR